MPAPAWGGFFAFQGVAPLEIRRIRADEAEALREIRLRALAEAPAAFCTRWSEAAREAPAVWEERAAEAASGDRRVALFACEGGRPCGLVRVYPSASDPEALEAISLWVEPAARRRGVATALMEALAVWARAAGARRLALEVHGANAAARALYRRLGFCEVPGAEGDGRLRLSRDI